MKTSTKVIAILIILLAIAGGVYWYIFFYGPGNKIEPEIRPTESGGFAPLDTSDGNATENPATTTDIESEAQASGTSTLDINAPIPALRLLSDSPVGGYGASTTATTTVIRWVDRGRGNIFEATGDSNQIVTLSNTVIPRMYESVWNKNLTAFVGSLLSSNSDIPTVVYASLNIQINTPAKTDTGTSTSTTTAESLANITPYSLKGKNLPEGMLNYAVSPKKDKIFMLIRENNQGTGYIANFDGTSVSKIFVTPLTQLNIEWPEENTLAVTTKGTVSQGGFLYFVNIKTGEWKKILGPTTGLSTKVSRDAKYVLASKTGTGQTINTDLYAVGTSTSINFVLRTLADKCVWGNLFKEMVYCAVPSSQPSGNFPDDWYKGIASFTDKIWQFNVESGDITLVSNIIDQADRLIDAYNLDLDPNDDFLFFMNKRDLSLWSFDLNSN